jgi:hypothetical protein
VTYLNGTHGTLHKDRIGLRLKEENFYWTDGGSLLMVALPYLTHWLPHLLSSSTKVFTQGGQLLRSLGPAFLCPKLSSISKTEYERSSLCARNNPQQGPRVPSQVQSVGGTPFENLIVEFTELPWATGCKYLLVFVCTFSGWVGLRKPKKWPGSC